MGARACVVVIISIVDVVVVVAVVAIVSSGQQAIRHAGKQVVFPEPYRQRVSPDRSCVAIGRATGSSSLSTPASRQPRWQKRPTRATGRRRRHSQKGSLPRRWQRPPLVGPTSVFQSRAQPSSATAKSRPIWTSTHAPNTHRLVQLLVLQLHRPTLGQRRCGRLPGFASVRYKRHCW